jgi:hypothetical protein
LDKSFSLEWIRKLNLNYSQQTSSPHSVVAMFYALTTVLLSTPALGLLQQNGPRVRSSLLMMGEGPILNKYSRIITEPPSQVGTHNTHF